MDLFKWLAASKRDTFIGENARNFGTSFQYVPAPKWFSAGGVVVAGLNPHSVEFVYIIKPANNYGGHGWTFPKGRVDDGESREVAACREVEEEAGLRARHLPNGYLGMHEGSMSRTHYMMMFAVGKPGAHDSESEEVRCVHIDDAIAMFEEHKNYRDLKVAKMAKEWIESFKERVV
jgi:8-oxo-dGTP pyrophosphatase MutT (NUDIX family)